jgi:ribosomal protein L1
VYNAIYYEETQIDGIVLKKMYATLKEKLVENFKTIFETMVKVKPAAAKGTYMKNVTVASPMGPGVKVDPASVAVK